ncbi:MAG: hypothetical protein HQ557_06655 [Bacteroidetes bacterium]|nr:hypothetical protein [Bacteroidota bacterium]
MNLNNFESYIDKKILARGRSYYVNDYITSIEEIDENVFEADVEGTETYLVEVELDDEANILDTICDCPYTMGEYCKHQTAVFFILRDMKEITSGGTNHQPKRSTGSESSHKSHAPKKRKTSDFKKILSGRTKDELVELLLDIASEFEEIKQLIELSLDGGNEEDEIIKAITLIRTFVNNHSDEYGFIAYGQTDEAIRGAELVLENARQAGEQNKAVHALNLILCVLHEMADLHKGMDDYYDVIGGVIEESLTMIHDIVEMKELSLVDKESILEKLIEESSSRRYENWDDWMLEILDSCTVLADIPALRNILEEHLVSMISDKDEEGDSWNSGYFAERVTLIRYNMVKHYGGQEKAQEFIGQNLQYSAFREMAIESAIKKKDYCLVTKLTLDGEEKDISLRGLVNKWRNYRYKSYQLSGMINEQRELAMDFILNGSFEYYGELKNTYDLKEWLSIYPSIISQLINQEKTYYDVYTRILIEEGEKQKLLEYVKGNPSTVENYYKHLIPEFKEEVFTLFLQLIEHAAAMADNRKKYQGVCAIIRNLKKAGGKKQVLEIKQMLFTQYAKRPAFMDELSRV